MSTDNSVSNTSDTTLPDKSSPQSVSQENVQEDWEFELDMLGTTASIESLEQHLDKVPDAKSATAQFLKGFIASHAQVSR